jgi:Cys-tRNA(Pro)/Cys-tRNA(Cys) deacylase
MMEVFRSSAIVGIVTRSARRHQDRSGTAKHVSPRRTVVGSTAKTNAIRLLERLGVTFGLREYEVEPEDLAAEAVARKVGLPAEQVFKTLVARGDKHGVCLAVVPGDVQLDLKALARATGDKKVDTVPLKEVEPLTGYIRGGVTALACKKNYPVYIDETAELFDVISISAGLRGLQVLLAPGDYVRVTSARVVPIARGKD